MKTELENRLICSHKSLTKAFTMNVGFQPMFNMCSVKTDPKGIKWMAGNVKTKAQALRAEVLASRNLADANLATERGDTAKAERLYAKAQYWLDRYNRLVGNA